MLRTKHCCDLTAVRRRAVGGLVVVWGLKERDLPQPPSVPGSSPEELPHETVDDCLRRNCGPRIPDSRLGAEQLGGYPRSLGE